MPFRSHSQRKKFYALKAEGKMSQKTIDEWQKDTPKNIPERLSKKAALEKLSEFKQDLSQKITWELVKLGAKKFKKKSHKKKKDKDLSPDEIRDVKSFLKKLKFITEESIRHARK